MEPGLPDIKSLPLLRDALANLPEPDPNVPFKPSAFYSQVGNILNVFVIDHEFAYAEDVDKTLTIYRDRTTKEIVGYKLWLGSLEHTLNELKGST